MAGNYYQNAFNGYTQYYANSQTNAQGSSVFGTTTAAGYASYPNSVYGAAYGQQNAANSFPANQAQRADGFASAVAVPNIYNTFVQPYSQTSAATASVGYSRVTGGGVHGAIGAPAGPKMDVGLIPISKAPQLAAGASAYDSLVYTTAAQMLQQQKASLQPRFTGGGNNKYKQFDQKKKSYNKDAQLHYCEICKISCAGKQTMQEHLEGQKHKKKEALIKGDEKVALPRTKVSFRCDLCSVTCTGQDTYDAHIRGIKHQKAATLVRKRGGLVPEEPTIIPPMEYQARMGYQPPPPPPPPQQQQHPVQDQDLGVQGQSSSGVPPKRVIGISTVSFVPSTKLNSTAMLESKKNETATMAVASSAGLTATELAISAQSEEIKAMIAAEKSVAPVGEEFIVEEKDAHGKLEQYHCKLCDCKFSDPNAKDIHLKGRRHRMQYKMKVDPSLEVEVKMPPNRRIGSRYGGPTRPVPNLQNSIPPWYGLPEAAQPPSFVRERRYDSVDDRHLQAKHAQICPEGDFLTRVTWLQDNIEATVKKVSDWYKERQGEGAEERTLQGVMRIGLLPAQLLLKGDEEFELVVTCSKIPTRQLFDVFSQQFKEQYTPRCDEDKAITVEVADASLLLHFADCGIRVRVWFTSKFLRDGGDGGEAATPPPGEPLDKTICLDALARLRQIKWFQARCLILQSAANTLRLLRDLRSRRPAWKPLTDWMCQLLVEKILSALPTPISTGDAFRRVIEAIASGFLSPLGPDLPDPCEKEQPNVLEALQPQAREDLMYDAQQCLRMIGFHQIYKVLGMERLPDVRPPLGAAAKKRPLDENSGVDGLKKDKKDGLEEKEEEEAEGMELA